MAVLWTAFIIYGLTKTPSTEAKYWWLEIEGVDKVLHAIIFGVEAFLLMWANERKRFTTVVIIGWCVLLGGVLELVQFHFVEGRNGDMLDLIADAAGALIGVLPFPLLVKR